MLRGKVGVTARVTQQRSVFGMPAARTAKATHLTGGNRKDPSFSEGIIPQVDLGCGGHSGKALVFSHVFKVVIITAVKSCCINHPK